MDITGDGAMEFFSNRVKVTSKWPISRKRSRENGSSSTDLMNGNGHHHPVLAEEPNDAANFAGQM